MNNFLKKTIDKLILSCYIIERRWWCYQRV